MNAGQSPARNWSTRRSEKARRVASLPVQGKVIPTDGLVNALEKLIAPCDRVVLEGNNQKQADFLSRMLAEVDPGKVHDLHMIMRSVGRSEHLDIFSKKASTESLISPFPVLRACVFRRCCRMVNSKSAQSIRTLSSTPVFTSTCAQTLH